MASESETTQSAETRLEGLGYTEVTEQERLYAEDIRATALTASAILRGALSFELKAEVDNESSSSFVQQCENSLSNKGHELEELNRPEDVLLLGTVRRLVGDKINSKALQTAISEYHSGNHQKMNALHAYINESIEVLRNPETKNILFIGPLGTISCDQMLEDTFEEFTESKKEESKGITSFLRKTFFSKPVRETVSAGMKKLSMPNLGLATVASEMKVALRGKMRDQYIDVTDDNAIEYYIDLAKSRGLDAVMIQVESDTMIRVCEVSKRFAEAGVKVIIGGLGTTLDPETLLRDGAGDLFIGEIEGVAGELAQKIFAEEPQTDTRTIYGQKNRINLSSDVSATYVKLTRERELQRGVRVNMEAAYAKEREIGLHLQQYRLEALEKMKPFSEINGRIYEVKTPILMTGITRGCPYTCEFCSTVGTEGTSARRKPVDMLIHEFEFTRTPYAVVVDQNAFELGEGEDVDSWIDYMAELFQELSNRNLKIGVQTSISSFMKMAVKAQDVVASLDLAEDCLNGDVLLYRQTPLDRARSLLQLDNSNLDEDAVRSIINERRLRFENFLENMSNSVYAALVGLEGDTSIMGARDGKHLSQGIQIDDDDTPRTIAAKFYGTKIMEIGKDPASYKPIIEFTRRLGIPLVASMISGIPAELTGGIESELLMRTDHSPEERNRRLGIWHNLVVGELELDILMVQAFTVIYGIPGFEMLKKKGLIDKGLTAHEVYTQKGLLEMNGIDSVNSSAEIVRDFYGLKNVLARVWRSFHEYSWKRALFVSGTGAGFLGINTLKRKSDFKFNLSRMAGILLRRDPRFPESKCLCEI